MTPDIKLDTGQKMKICAAGGTPVSILNKRWGSVTLGVIAGYNERGILVRERREYVAPVRLIEVGEASDKKGRLRFRILHEQPFTHHYSVQTHTGLP